MAPIAPTPSVLEIDISVSKLLLFFWGFRFRRIWFRKTVQVSENLVSIKKVSHWRSFPEEKKNGKEKGGKYSEKKKKNFWRRRKAEKEKDAEGALRSPTTYDNHPVPSIPSIHPIPTYSIEDNLSFNCTTLETSQVKPINRNFILLPCNYDKLAIFLTKVSCSSEYASKKLNLQS